MRRSGSGTELLSPTRPGSSGGATSKSSLVRLPDENPATGRVNIVGMAVAEGSGSRPSSSSGSGKGSPNGQALVRLPDELRKGDDKFTLYEATSSSSTAAKRPGSSSGKASLAVLREGGNPPTDVSLTAAGSVRDRLKNSGLRIETAKKETTKAFHVLQAGETIDKFYDFGDQIHDGGPRGRVSKGIRRSDDKMVVIKVRAKRPDKAGERAWREIMSQLCSMRSQSAHVLDITEILEDDTSFFIVMPMCEGGELFNFLITEAEVPESECKRIMREILQAIGHLHANNMIHRDVKPENILFDVDKECRNSPKTLKLIDFDTCMGWTPVTPKSRQFVGTPGYIAPEALLGEASPQSDLWSVGVICYILMTGETPWVTIDTLEDGTVGSPGAKRMYKSLKDAVIDWDCQPWPDFPLARDLCQKLMAFDAEERPISAPEALDHPWLAI